MVVRSVGVFKVFEDAAFKLVDMLQPFFPHQDGRLFAANAPGAEAHHGFVLQLCLVRAKGVRKLRELGNAPVNCVGERPCVHLERVARIQRHHLTASVVMALL